MNTRPYLVQSREQYEVNTDPLRRCYDGCHFKSEWVWSKWNTLYDLPTQEEAEDSVKRWQALAEQSGRRLEYRWVREDAKV